MEAQNHFYGHSAALAQYAGLSAPRHIAGLVQHGWTLESPVDTHFRDLQRVGRPRSNGAPNTSRQLFVWSHASRAWDAAQQERPTVAIGAQWLYLCESAGALPAPRDELDELVVLPVHGIETQRVRGDHAALAEHFRQTEGRPATVCLYPADARDPEIVKAYAGAGHRCVTLGERLDARFLWRLWTMMGRADRVVSNRLSTPVLYAAHLDKDIAVYGDAMKVDGEAAGTSNAVQDRWPELHGVKLDRSALLPVARAELGTDFLRDPAQLRSLLGWDGHKHPGVWLDYWLTSPATRAITNVRRRRANPLPTGQAEAHPSLGWAAWLQAAASYLPGRLASSNPAPVVHEPLPVEGAGR